MIYLILFTEFFLIGLFTFGGGYAMIPLVNELVVDKYNWLTKNQFVDFIGVCESTPGPIAINMATYVGATQGGLLGSIITTLGVVLPSFIIILIIASVLKRIIKNRYVQLFLNGIKPVVIALILSTGVILTIEAIGFNFETLKLNFNLDSLIIFLIVTFTFYFSKLVLKKKINTIVLILISALCGIFLFLI